jgi:hypothetical protein
LKGNGCSNYWGILCLQFQKSFLNPIIDGWLNYSIDKEIIIGRIIGVHDSPIPIRTYLVGICIDLTTIGKGVIMVDICP